MCVRLFDETWGRFGSSTERLHAIRSSSPSRPAPVPSSASAEVRLDSLPHGLLSRRARPALASAVVMASIWRLLSTTAESSRACSSAKGRGCGLTTSAKK